MKRMIWTLGLFALIAGCSDDGAVTSDILSGEERAMAERLAAVDPAAGKDLAAWCARCHGADGVSVDAGLPSLADQQPLYLATRLMAYKDGRREDSTMGTVVRSLGDDAVIRVAAYYAALEPPPPELPGTISDDGPAGPIEAGREAAMTCADCHGADGNSEMAGVPTLAGRHPEDLVAAMRAYKNGSRGDETMQFAMESFSDADIVNSALYYAVQQPRRTDNPGSGDIAAGRRIAAGCAACHGEEGNSADPNTPSLAGQDAEYLVAATRAYQDGTRGYLMMAHPIATLSDHDIEDVSAFYASQEPEAARLRRPLTTEDWVARCDRCHGAGGSSTDPRHPKLSAQRPEYVETAIRAYQAGTRVNSMMHAMTALLSEREIADIAAYYATSPRVAASTTTE